MTHPRRSIATALLAMATLSAGVALAGDRVPGPNAVDLPVEHLALAESPALVEGTRGMGDEFPYLEVHGTRRSVTTAELRPLLRAKSGKGPVIGDGDTAIELVRLFVAGTLVKDQETGERIVEAARELQRTLKYMKPKVTDFRPSAYGAFAVKLNDREAGHVVWHVNLTALETDRMLRLVQVNATISTTGEIEIERKPVVDGPMTVWQTAFMMGEDTRAQVQVDREMRAEAALARKRYLEALRPARDLWSVWSLGRLLFDPADLRAAFGPADRDTLGDGKSGSLVYRMADGSWAVFDVAEGRVRGVIRQDAPDPDDARVLTRIYRSVR